MKLRALAASLALCLVGSSGFAQGRPAGVAVILVPGAGGPVPSDFLMRNQQTLASYGLATAVATSASQAASTASSLKAQGASVVLVGMSAGTPTVAEALALGAPADKVVFAAGTLMPGYAQRSVADSLGSPGRLPPTLVLHHRRDECRLTPPEAVGQFVRWSGGRARVRWIDGGTNAGQPCGPMSAHGFYGRDDQAIAAIASFAGGR